MLPNFLHKFIKSEDCEKGGINREKRKDYKKNEKGSDEKDCINGEKGKDDKDCFC